MSKKTLYELLGISPEATSDEIRFAYRRRASETHPDKGGDKGEFEAVKFAYDVLIDKERRAEYDTYGEASAQNSDKITNLFGTLFASALRRASGSNPFTVSELNVRSIMENMLDDEEASTSNDIAEIHRETKALNKHLKHIKGEGAAVELAKAILNDLVHKARIALAERTRHKEEINELRAYIAGLEYDMQADVREESAKAPDLAYLHFDPRN